MAEMVVNFVVGKLADIIVKEVQLLGGVAEQVKWAQRELIRIQCCLKDAESKRKGDARVHNWLNELRDVAYHIEDATDTFFLEVEDNRQKDFSFLQKLKKLRHKPMEVPVLHKLATELGEIRQVLEEISKSRVDYGIESLQEKGKEEAIILPFRRAANQEVDETEIVGLKVDKNNILKLLRPEETLRRAVITIVGTGGLGKTTLAQMVYESAKADFDYHIILSISQEYNVMDLLRKMISKLKYSIAKEEEVDNLKGELKCFLRSKRYLIVLDDVWKEDLWNQLKDALPDAKNGSRVLMTSRYIDIAKSADPKMTPYELDFLSDKESLDLLLKKALPNQEPDEECPIDLLGVADALSKRCKGLPLALIVVGGILSTKYQTYTAWERVLRTMNWHADGKDCMKVLAMSYEDMPYYLKACFIYLASFPEDYEISAKRLIRMWVAEGFIPPEENKTMEETAEDCLEKLFQRSMVQVSSRYTNGLIKSCRVHDLLRDLALHEAGEVNFVTVFSRAQDVNQPNIVTRRASFQFCSPYFMEYVGPKTRSLQWFGQQLPKRIEFRLLKVLEIVGNVNLDYSTHDLKGLEELIHLKYLGFRNCPNLHIPACFSHLKNLETLDLRATKIEPQIIRKKKIDQTYLLWAIGTLRHVISDHNLDGPKSTANLRNLQTLKWISIPSTWEGKLPRLNSLRKLGLSNPSDSWGITTNLIGTLPSLVSLGIKGSSISKEIVYPSALPNYEKLQSLYLNGNWSKRVTFEASSLPPHLVKLTLIGSQLQQDPMPELGKLMSLKKLRLGDGSYSGRQMICPAGFPVLQYLEVTDWWIKDLKVAKGVMPKLKYLKTSSSCTLQVPPELQHLTINFKN